MKKTFWNKRIPSLLGLLFLAVSVGIVSWFGKNYTEFRGKASVGEMPDNVRISNITDTSFTVSYTTRESVTGIINYGRDSNFGQVGFDDRETDLPAGQAGNPSARRTHYITISSLNPDTKYYFVIQSGTTEARNNNQPYEVTTAPRLSESASSPTSLAGSVNLQDGTIPMDGIVYLSASASQLLSVPLKNDGTYLLPVNSLRTSDLTSYFILKSDTILQMTILNAIGQSRVSVKAARTNPIPLVTLSKDYDFTVDASRTDSTASESAQLSGDAPSGALSPAPSPGFPLFTDQTASTPDILTPKEAERFTDQQPLFRGTAANPNATVVINIDATQGLQNSVKADNYNNWQFRPASPLSPGGHSITIQTLDSSGIKQTIERSFTILADGSQFTEPSVSPPLSPTPPNSPSSTPTPVKSEPTASPTPTMTPAATSTPAPTTTPAISPTPALLPTTIPTATVIPSSPPISPPGSSSLFIGGALAMLSIAAGFMLFFLL